MFSLEVVRSSSCEPWCRGVVVIDVEFGMRRRCGTNREAASAS